MTLRSSLTLFVGAVLALFMAAPALIHAGPPGGQPPTVSFSASPTTITVGQSTTLTWGSLTATSCTGVGFSTGNAKTGSATVSPTVTTTYGVECYNGYGDGYASLTITVQSAPAASVTLTASPSSITQGSSATLTWSSSNATSCSGTNFGTSGATSGTKSVSPSVTTTYSVTCTGAGGSGSSSRTVTVTPPACSWSQVGPTVWMSDNMAPYGEGSCVDFTGSDGYCSQYQYYDGPSDVSGQNPMPGEYCSAFSPTKWCTKYQASNYCTGGGARPNLVALNQTPLSGSSHQTGTTISFTARITNSGTAGAASFPNNVQFCDSGCTSYNQTIAATTLASLASGANATVSASASFASANTYYYRFCADKNASGNGNIVESEESDNCSAWTSITVSVPAPTLSASCTVAPTTATLNENVVWSATATGGQVPAAGHWVSLGSTGWTKVCSGGGSTANIQQPACSGADGWAGGPNPTASCTIGETCRTHSYDDWSAENDSAQGCIDPNYGGGGGGTGGPTIYNTVYEYECQAASGGSSYTYSWSGTDGLSGSASSIGKAYATAGTKTGSVTVTHAGSGQQVTQACSASVAVAAQPELTAGAITPTTAITGQAQTYSATISNTGVGATGAAFTNLYQIRNSGGTQIDSGTISTAALGGSSSRVVTFSETLSPAGTYTIRACADLNGSMVGTIAESDETNNCGPWTTITVSAPPVPVATLTNNGPIVSGSSATLTYSCTNSTSASISGIGSVTPVSGGTRSTGALSANTNYQLTCTGTGGSDNDATTVSVTNPTVDLSVSPDRVNSGGSVNITWTSAQCTNVVVTRNGSTISTGVLNQAAPGLVANNITSQTTFVASCPESPSATETIIVNLVPVFEEF